MLCNLITLDNMSANNKIGLVSVNELIGMNFIIPGYQRGYRWEELQVTELLNDLYAFIKTKGYYCLQPLVVKSSNNLNTFKSNASKLLEQSNNDNLVTDIQKLIKDSSYWEVIDGQQRLTTIYIILKILKEDIPLFNISYETRKKSQEFLCNIRNKTKEESDENIDYFHMYRIKEAVKSWISSQKDKNIEQIMTDTLLNRVKFIWYESIGEDPIEVFTRLNIGKISLTDAELIKATLLNKSNFQNESWTDIKTYQDEIAKQWDDMEYALQNDEFWLFLNSPSYKRSTRIDFIFELIKERDIFNIKKEHSKLIGSGRYSVYRYFAVALSHFMKDANTVYVMKEKIWEQITDIFNTFNEWFTDIELYHYIGFILCDITETDKFKKIAELYSSWKDSADKDAFKDTIRKDIKTIIKCSKEQLNKLHFDDNKEQIRKILLLHNICSVLQSQNTQEDKYKLHVFYKFPFHLFKNETWNVEHIDSATTNDLERDSEKKAWAKAMLYALSMTTDADSDKIQEYKRDLNTFLKTNINAKDSEKYKAYLEDFTNLHSKTESVFGNVDKLTIIHQEGGAEDNERMHIWNLALLDEGTNKSYKNSIFSVKRAFVIYKEMGHHCKLKDNGTVEIDENKAIAFIPPCTKHVFMKYYTKDANNLLVWSKLDAEAYLRDIESKLEHFLN